MSSVFKITYSTNTLIVPAMKFFTGKSRALIKHSFNTLSKSIKAFTKAILFLLTYWILLPIYLLYLPRTIFTVVIEPLRMAYAITIATIGLASYMTSLLVVAAINIISIAADIAVTIITIPIKLLKWCFDCLTCANRGYVAVEPVEFARESKEVHTYQQVLQGQRSRGTQRRSAQTQAAKAHVPSRRGLSKAPHFHGDRALELKKAATPSAFEARLQAIGYTEADLDRLQEIKPEYFDTIDFKLMADPVLVSSDGGNHYDSFDNRTIVGLMSQLRGLNKIIKNPNTGKDIEPKYTKRDDALRAEIGAYVTLVEDIHKNANSFTTRLIRAGYRAEDFTTLRKSDPEMFDPLTGLLMDNPQLLVTSEMPRPVFDAATFMMMSTTKDQNKKIHPITGKEYTVLGACQADDTTKALKTRITEKVADIERTLHAVSCVM